MLRRTPLSRKTPLKRGGELKRSKPMNKVSTQKRRSQAKAAKLLYCDSFGTPFGDAQRFMAKLPSKLWFPMKPLKRPEVLRFMHEQAGEPAMDMVTHERTTFGKCWLSGDFGYLTAHHVVSRWDFAGNILMCNWHEHERIQHNQDALPEVLRALVKHNPFVSWIHLIRARGSLFPFTTLD